MPQVKPLAWPSRVCEGSSRGAVCFLQSSRINPGSGVPRAGSEICSLTELPINSRVSCAVHPQSGAAKLLRSHPLLHASGSPPQLAGERLQCQPGRVLAAATLPHAGQGGRHPLRIGQPRQPPRASAGGRRLPLSRWMPRRAQDGARVENGSGEHPAFRPASWRRRMGPTAMRWRRPPGRSSPHRACISGATVRSGSRRRAPSRGRRRRAARTGRKPAPREREVQPPRGHPRRHHPGLQLGLAPRLQLLP